MNIRFLQCINNSIFVTYRGTNAVTDPSTDSTTPTTTNATTASTITTDNTAAIVRGVVAVVFIIT